MFRLLFILFSVIATYASVYEYKNDNFICNVTDTKKMSEFKLFTLKLIAIPFHSSIKEEYHKSFSKFCNSGDVICDKDMIKGTVNFSLLDMDIDLDTNLSCENIIFNYYLNGNIKANNNSKVKIEANSVFDGNICDRIHHTKYNPKIEWMLYDENNITYFKSTIKLLYGVNDDFTLYEQILNFHTNEQTSDDIMNIVYETMIN